MSSSVSRRGFLPLAGIGAAAGYASLKFDRSAPPLTPLPGKSAVAIVRAGSYSADLAGRIRQGIQECGLDVRGKNVLLKPNLVEFDRSTAINTDVAVVAAAVDVFRALGAHVRIGEGPGHRRDTYELASEARYRSEISNFDALFTDLNCDDVSPVKHFGGLDKIYLPNTALRADLIVSLPKMKTHHWAGATLSMKNFFGLVPGAVYGWPKNQLHYVGIPQSIIALNRIFRRTFAIVDGIVGMEGNGPIQGTPKPCGVLVMGSDLAAVDATCCRIMGINPEHVEYLHMAAELGHTTPDRIEQRGEKISAVQSTFASFDKFRDRPRLT
ncbi:MAG TPA: DUF362 domain-containing protein [Bryobacteraceae bacterium]|nr:DUF362 domain-containing protein [Bryobacteraceae bacterium]